MSERVLAIDLGDRRTGVAVGDTVSGTAMPLTVLTVQRGPELLDAVVRTVQDHGPDMVLMGLPLNMDDTRGPRAELTEAFAASVQEATGVPVHMVDERLTSFEAEQRMRGTSRREKKERADAIAACVMLEAWLAERQ